MRKGDKIDIDIKITGLSNPEAVKFLCERSFLEVGEIIKHQDCDGFEIQIHHQDKKEEE